MRRIVLMSVLLCGMAPLTTQAQGTGSHPCATDPGFSQFDFWVGRWDVFLANGNKAGTNVIEKVENGCLILENWLGVDGSTGKSINFYNAVSETWKQTWISGGGQGYLIDVEGRLDGKSIVMQGSITYYGPGTVFTYRGTWTPLEDRRVHQVLEQSPDGGESWQPWFDGYYVRAETVPDEN